MKNAKTTPCTVAGDGEINGLVLPFGFYEFRLTRRAKQGHNAIIAEDRQGWTK
ncbi:hypothetical protein [Bradyrhizobium betae]|uniref:hypothetical protein n=1 Tax=Bradyrhizobium betae TaxID=244734 RepID=UPI0013E973D2|nr:hypothetical protein [Bradyrhizobium betae]